MCNPELEDEHHPSTQSLSLLGMGERIREVKVRKFMGWDKGSFIAKSKAAHTSKAKFSTFHQQADVQPFPRKQGFVLYNDLFERQMPFCQSHASSFFFSTAFIAVEISPQSSWVCCPDCVPCQFLEYPSLPIGREMSETRKFSVLYKHCSEITLEYFQHYFHHQYKT